MPTTSIVTMLKAADATAIGANLSPNRRALPTIPPGISVLNTSTSTRTALSNARTVNTT